ncbi:sensor histidine kinase, partial [bacterium]|nr:sensor histidine kinase [bacterium]
MALAIASLSVVAVGVLISRVAALRALRPLKSMAQDAARVTHSSLQERVTYEGPPDELGTLADSLNAMLDRLEGAFEEQRRFVADASHELRTPVAVIRGHLDLLGQPWVDATEREESLRIVDDEIGRMQRLLDDMLALARVQPAPSRPFQRLEVSTMLAEVAARGKALGTREFERMCEPDLWVEGDPDLLEAALQNLVRNAVEHTVEGGRIILSCRREGLSAVIEIADDGPGIREEDLPRIFDRFFRTSGPRPVASGGS